LPSPTKPRPAGVWSLQDLPEAGKPAAGWGGVGGGGRAILRRWRHRDLTAPPPPRRSAAKLAQAAQACLRAPALPTRGRVKTEFAACADSISTGHALASPAIM